MVAMNEVHWCSAQVGNNTLNFGYDGVLEYYPDSVEKEFTITRPSLFKEAIEQTTTTEAHRLTRPPANEATAYYEESITYKVENVTSANGNFGLLAAAAYSYRGSYVCSPIGSMIPLAILYLLGPTNQVSIGQFEAALVDYEPVKVVEYYSSLLPDLNNRQRNCFIELAGQVFLGEKYDFVYKGNYIKNVKRAFGSLPIFIDFEDKEDAADDLNTWVTNATNNFIGNIFKEKDIRSDTEVLIVSVLYIQVSWKRKFDSVRLSKFYGTKTKKVVMMRIPYYGGLKYGDISAAQLLELPINDDMRMLIILPKKRGGLHDLMNCYGNNTEWLKGDITNTMFTLSVGVDVSIPRFRINSLKFDVTDIYKKGLKMDSIFLKTGQKYEGLTPHEATVHQAYQAVSISLINMGGESSDSHSESGPIVFQANHPFYFIVYNVDLEVASGMYLGPKK